MEGKEKRRKNWAIITKGGPNNRTADASSADD
jgi:hypothetical protein